MLGNFLMLLLSSAFFKINCFKIFSQEHYQSVKRIWMDLGLSGSEVFAKVVSRQQKSLLAWKELIDSH